MAGSKISKYVTCFSIVYVVVIILSLWNSLQLPYLEDVRANRNNNCYWTDAMIAYVECGHEIFAHGPREFFYGFWMLFIYAPIFSALGSVTFIAVTILIYTPLVFLIFSLARAIRY